MAVIVTEDAIEIKEEFDPEQLNKLSLTTNEFPNYNYSEEAAIAKDMPDQVSIIHYRGYDIPLCMDDPGQQFYCILNGEEVGFGAYNFNYKDDIIYLVDQRFDMIYYFKNYHGAKLSWFTNGGYRDIQLTYRTRVLKVFPTFDNFTLTEQVVKDLIEESNRILPKFIKK